MTEGSNYSSVQGIKLCLGSIGHKELSDMNESCYKRTILQRNYRKMATSRSFSYNSLVKFYGKKILE